MTEVTAGRRGLGGRSLRVWGSRLGGLVILGLTVLLVHRLVAEAGWTEVWERLRGAHPLAVLTAAGLLTFQLGVWALRLRLAVLRLSVRVPGWMIFGSVVAGAAVNLLVPFARLVVPVLRARYLAAGSEPRRPKRVFVGAVLFDQMVHSVVMAAVTVFGLVSAALLLDRGALALALAAASLGVGALLAYGVKVYEGKRQASGGHDHRSGRSEGSGLRVFADLGGRRGSEASGDLPEGPEDEEEEEAAATPPQGLWDRLKDSGREVVRVLRELAARPALLRAAGGLTGLYFLWGVAAQWVVFVALDARVGLLQVAVTLALGLTAGVLVGTPGGVGGTEAAMIALYGALGLEPVTAASGVLLFRGLYYGLVLVLGLGSLGLLELRLAADRRPSPDPDRGKV